MLKEDEDHLQGTVKLMFQNAEEVFKGANDMIEHGILEEECSQMLSDFFRELRRKKKEEKNAQN